MVQAMAQACATIMLISLGAAVAMGALMELLARGWGWGEPCRRVEPALRAGAAWAVASLALGSAMGTVDFWALPCF